MSMGQHFFFFFFFVFGGICNINAVGKCLREGLLTTSDAFLSHDREAIALN